MNQKEIYDKVYREISGYNSNKTTRYDEKDAVVLDFFSRVSGTLLDVGCGAGHNLKMALSLGVDVFGIDVSEECCKRFLSGIPHQCIDIVGFCKQDRKFDNIICTDVLEHITEDSIDETLECISSISPSALFGIANHEDNLLRIELHLIRENKDWWTEKLSEYYSSVIFRKELFNGTFFFIECEK